VVLWTRFGEPGEHRLTVEVVAEQEATGDDDDGGTVTVTRDDVVVDVQPAEIALDVRTRALSPPADLRSDDEDQNAGGISLGGIEGVFGGGGGLQTAEDDETESVQSADSPVAVTVVNTGTSTADRVSLTAVTTPVGTSDGEGSGDGNETDPTVEVGPFVVEDVAPGEERQVVVDLGPLDERSDVTVTAAFRSELDASGHRCEPDGDVDAPVSAAGGEPDRHRRDRRDRRRRSGGGRQPRQRGHRRARRASSSRSPAPRGRADSGRPRVLRRQRGRGRLRRLRPADRGERFRGGRGPDPDRVHRARRPIHRDRDGGGASRFGRRWWRGSGAVGTLGAIGIVGLVGGAGVAVAGSVIRRRDV